MRYSDTRQKLLVKLHKGEKRMVGRVDEFQVDVGENIFLTARAEIEKVEVTDRMANREDVV